MALVSPSGRVERTVGASRGLPSDAVKSIAAFRGKVYVGTDAGLGVSDDGSWNILTRAAQTDLKNVYLRAEPGGKALWAGAVNLGGGLLRFDGSRWEFMGGKNRGLLNNVKAFAFQDDAAWLGTSTSGVCRLAGDAFGQFRTADGLPSANVLALEAFGGAVWAGTSAGAARYENGRWTPFAAATGFPLKVVFCAAASPTALYLGGRGGLVRYRAGRFETFAQEGASLGDVNALLWAEDTLYAGTSRGLFLLKGW
jgi:ligand-binding sensor domain-containing protein